MKKYQLMLIGLLAIISIPIFAETITLDQVITDSLQKNTSLYRAQREHDDKLADASDIKALDNPALKVDAIRSDVQSGRGVDVELAQPLKFSQLSGARSRYAQALIRVADTEQKFELLNVINQTTALYTQVWLLSARHKLYASYANDAEKMNKVVRAGANQGQTSPAAAYLFSADSVKLRVDADAVQVQLRQVRAELARLTGKNYQTLDLQRPHFATISEDVEKLTAFAQTRSNLRSVIKARLQAAEQHLRVAKQDAALPEIGPRVLYSRSPNGDEKSYGIGLELRIPLWNQNDAERKRAKAQWREIKSETDLWAALPQKDIIHELQKSATELQARVDSYFENILPDYQKSYALTRDMFHQGQINALDVWQVREKLLSAENEALDAVAQAVNARGALELELGGKLEEVK